jgi:hypothetical protein
MNNIRTALEKHSRIAKYIVLGYIVFAGCFVFPFGNEMFPMNLSKAYLIVASYGIIALGFVGVYGEHKVRFVYASTLILTIVGMILRFLLEYGEVSNTMNFTQLNVVSYLVIVPVFVTGAYYILIQYLTSHAEK